jgi:hypothetical protein
MDVMGTDIDYDVGALSGEANKLTEKILTWDQVSLTVTPDANNGTVFDNAGVQSFNFSINNNLSPEYAISGTVGSQNLFPYDIVPGIRTISGDITFYGIPDITGFEKWGDYTGSQLGSFTFNLGGSSKTVNCRFHRIEPAASTGAVTSTLAFTAIAPNGSNFSL